MFKGIADTFKHKKSKADRDTEELARRLSKLALDGGRKTQRLHPVPQDRPSSQGWTGGFRAADSKVDSSYSSFNEQSISAAPPFPAVQSYPLPGPLPQPPPVLMPIPQHPNGEPFSRTMQYAVSEVPLPNPHDSQVPPSLRPSHAVPQRPHSDPIPISSPTSPSAPLPGRRPPSMAPRKSNPLPAPASVPLKASRLDVSGSATPARNPRRANSDPVTPTSASTRSNSGNGTSVQCSGRTKKGLQCKNMVKTPLPLGQMDQNLNKKLERYCNIHSKEINQPSGFYANGEWVEFSNWIPGYLQANTRTNLRLEMAKQLSSADDDGYIYTFQIRDPGDPTHAHLKVGRATSLNKRIDEWSKQCSSKEQVLRGWWPEGLKDGISLLKGTVDPGEKGRYCHRLERLIHLELADIAQNAPYLDPKFPDVVVEDKAIARSTASCPDCGTNHQEIFIFTRAKSGKFKGKEWERIVKPVIEKWGEFVEMHAQR